MNNQVRRVSYFFDKVNEVEDSLNKNIYNSTTRKYKVGQAGRMMSRINQPLMEMEMRRLRSKGKESDMLKKKKQEYIQGLRKWAPQVNFKIDEEEE